MLGIDPNKEVSVISQQRGVSTSVQLLQPDGTPYQLSDFTLDPSKAGTADPLTSSHDENPSWVRRRRDRRNSHRQYTYPAHRPEQPVPAWTSVSHQCL